MAKNEPPESPAANRKGHTSMAAGLTGKVDSSGPRPPRAPLGAAAAQRKGHSQMEVPQQQRADTSAGPPPGYGGEGTMSRGSRKRMSGR